MQQRTAPAFSSTGTGDSPCPRPPGAASAAGAGAPNRSGSGCWAGADAEESSGESTDVVSDPQAQQRQQAAAFPPLVHWLASTDHATRRHAHGILAAVQMATAISLWLQPPLQHAPVPQQEQQAQQPEPALPAAEPTADSQAVGSDTAPAARPPRTASLAAGAGAAPATALVAPERKKRQGGAAGTQQW